MFMPDMLCSAADPHYIRIGDAFFIALLGMVIFLTVLIVLMLCISFAGKIIEKSPDFAKKHPGFFNMVARIKASATKKKSGTAVSAKDAPMQKIADIKPEAAPGSCGNLTLIRTDERDAAMIMAIVADTLETPLNELRFLSIKRID